MNKRQRCKRDKQRANHKARREPITASRIAFMINGPPDRLGARSERICGWSNVTGRWSVTFTMEHAPEFDDPIYFTTNPNPSPFDGIERSIFEVPPRHAMTSHVHGANPVPMHPDNYETLRRELERRRR